jgi:primosomal protein N''
MRADKLYVKVILPLKLRDDLTYSVPDILKDEVSIGAWVNVLLVGRKQFGVISRILDEPDIDPSMIRDVTAISPLHPVGEEEIGFWRVLADYYMCTVGEVFKSAYSLAFRKQADVRSRKPKAGEAMQTAHLPELSEIQENAKVQIRSHFKEHKTVLLEGVTGSGKTAIYMHLAQEELDKGHNVLYLVPEIAISRQLQERLENHFGERVLIFHSKQTAPQRKRVYDQLLTGGKEAHLILGTRSAIFLPFRSLSLVIIDEEHDSSYKQTDPSPRYNGRDAAIMLATGRKANVLLGSATPSFESLLNVENGKYAKVSLPVKYFQTAEPPEIKVIDTASTRRLRNMRGSFAMQLVNEIRATVERGEQVMVFRSRRAYSPIVQCTECGATPKCPHCNVSLSYHKAKNRLQCHYCNYSIPFSTRCPECGEYSLVNRGTGTEKIEEELQEIFPDFKIARFDSETTESKVREQKILKDFAAGHTNILVGTQMITKGFDFEKLTLVAVISADSLFAVQDFRADERAFQLLEQLMGRAGRRGSRGRIFIQTEQPEHPVILRLLKTSSQTPSLARQAALDRLQERSMFGYPPYVRLILITLRDRHEGRLWHLGRDIQAILAECGISDYAGPIAPLIDFIDNKHITQFWIKLPRDRQLSLKKRLLQTQLDNLNAKYKNGPDILVDVDPY